MSNNWADDSWTFSMKAGLVVRRQLKRELMQVAWRFGLDIDIQESKGLLESVLRVRVTGEPGSVDNFRSSVGAWLRGLATT